MDSKNKKMIKFCEFFREVLEIFVMIVVSAMLLFAVVYMMFALAVGW